MHTGSAAGGTNPTLRTRRRSLLFGAKFWKERVLPSAAATAKWPPRRRRSPSGGRRARASSPCPTSTGSAPPPSPTGCDSRSGRSVSLALAVRARAAQTVRLDDACAPIAQTVCNDLCSILVSAAMPHLQARDSDLAKPRKLGAEDLLAAVVSLQNIVARARRTQAPGGAPCARELTPPVGGAARRAGRRLPGRLGLWPRRRTAQRLRRQQRLRSAPATGIGGGRG
eukprot:COSAG04_NODE_8242_length_1002_cov_2.428571_1_plen_225_part_10